MDHALNRDSETLAQCKCVRRSCMAHNESHTFGDAVEQDALVFGTAHDVDSEIATPRHDILFMI